MHSHEAVLADNVETRKTPVGLFMTNDTCGVWSCAGGLVSIMCTLHSMPRFQFDAKYLCQFFRDDHCVNDVYNIRAIVKSIMDRFTCRDGIVDNQNSTSVRLYDKTEYRSTPFLRHEADCQSMMNM